MWMAIGERRRNLGSSGAAPVLAGPIRAVRLVDPRMTVPPIDATARFAANALRIAEDRARREAVQLIRSRRFARINDDSAQAPAKDRSWLATSST